jgi:hypothetical protein
MVPSYVCVYLRWFMGIHVFPMVTFLHFFCQLNVDTKTILSLHNSNFHKYAKENNPEKTLQE